MVFGLSWEAAEISLKDLVSAGFFMVWMTLGLVALSAENAARLRYHEEWAILQID
jgi:hypothetical protein